MGAGCVEVEAAYSGAPPGQIGRVPRVQWDELDGLDPKTVQFAARHVETVLPQYGRKEVKVLTKTSESVGGRLRRGGRLPATSPDSPPSTCAMAVPLVADTRAWLLPLHLKSARDNGPPPAGEISVH